MKNKNTQKLGEEMHANVPPDWYFSSIKINPFQRYWHKRRFEEVRKLVEKKDGEILDIGSADGVFTKVILDKSGSKKITGIDVLKTSVNWANNHWKKNRKLVFKVGDAHKLDFGTNKFDAVFALEVLEHVPDPQKVFHEIKRVLKSNGYAVLLVPTDSVLFRLIWFFWVKFWRGRVWDDCHIQSFNKKHTLAKELMKAGFVIEIDKKFILGMLNVVKVRKR